MTIKTILKELDIDFSYLAKSFGYKDVKSFYASARRTKVENGVISFYSLFKEKISPRSISLKTIDSPEISLEKEINNLVAYVNLKDFKTAKIKAQKILQELENK